MKVIVALIFFAVTSINAQWIGGAGYQSKSSVPHNGAAFYLINKLPFQWPAAGFSVKGKLNYFYSRETFSLYTTESTEGYQEFSADIFLETTFFTGTFQPFVELGLGGGYITGVDYHKSFFSLSGGTGLKVFYQIQPFIELHFRQAIPELNNSSGLDIESFQIAGVIGILFNF